MEFSGTTRINRENLPQVRLSKDQHTVQAFPAEGANQALNIRILPSEHMPGKIVDLPRFLHVATRTLKAPIAEIGCLSFDRSELISIKVSPGLMRDGLADKRRGASQRTVGRSNLTKSNGFHRAPFLSGECRPSGME
jgi:hypothetical protein